MEKLKKFFGPVTGSLEGILIPSELYRSFLTSAGFGTTIGLITVIITGIVANANAIFPKPETAALAVSLGTLVLDLLRRQNQGVPMHGKPDSNSPPTLTVPQTMTLTPKE